MKRIIFFLMIMSLLNCSAQITETENGEIINFKVISFSGDYIKEIEVNLKDPIVDEVEFIYLLIGNLEEKNCKKVKVNFKIGEHDINKNIKLVSFEKRKIILDISSHEFSNINLLYFNYSNVDRKYSETIYYKNTKSMLETVQCY